ncbi:hypothetical protein H112_06624 [Trichophyton rubrum D6]|nr:uncharacterized protein TERG_01980 [Trichophyton rubrum CBS 118892]EZF12508.1 hypothetical protein H100_06641 [Trichophyton rubrum MR850]EZF39273.1 hypothetical protein H102_06608 [Trichophyton rubrum CBS 100081]EZF49919.1 hypothetical protein H103_06632 [Trichophyton rubrum CBS 288.86]EZF60555.1 hypothetical protein H104_06587 [Trichophyton rubrum CBS 289.86]EZF71013.1 hypothetical protein H105_06645 [Trichophyton soudanense CBS 452.61]EZF81748.1 hypothetical protein H110_06629 [Trichophy
MTSLWMPQILRPDYTWPRQRPALLRVSEITPPVPHIPGRTVRLIWGLIHRGLCHFSKWYCHWFGIPFDHNIVQLPFGLLMKWTDRTNLEEVAAMQMVAAAGIPAPKFLCCGEHPNQPFNRTFSILMTRLPGITLENSDDLLQVEGEEPWLEELKTCVDAMRQWSPPEKLFTGSVLRTPILSQRVPRHIMGPFTTQEDLYDYLFSAASAHGFPSKEKFQETLVEARKIYERPHRVVFTHGDFKAHNILVDNDGHLSGFLDWESAGWYPEYWEFTTAMRFGRNSWWYQVAAWMGGDQYSQELSSDVALNLLTVDSYVGM